MNSKVANDLEFASNFLSEDNWTKCHSFLFEKNKLYIDYIGSIKLAVDPNLRTIYNRKVSTPENYFDLNVANNYCIKHYTLGKFRLEENDNCFTKAWNYRPFTLSSSPEAKAANLNYLCSMVGLTADYNDHYKTSLQMVIDKMKQAIQIAEIIEASYFY